LITGAEFSILRAAVLTWERIYFVPLQR